MIALLCLAGQGCTTDVVDFPLQVKAKDSGPHDIFPGSCSLTDAPGKKEGLRVWTCYASGSDAKIVVQEKLACDVIPLDGGFGGKPYKVCKLCSWSKFPEKRCKMCYDAAYIKTYDSCQGNDAGM